MKAMDKKIFDPKGPKKSESIRGSGISSRNIFGDDLSSVSKRNIGTNRASQKFLKLRNKKDDPNEGQMDMSKLPETSKYKNTST